MESFSLLKYWRGGGGATSAASSSSANMRTTTIAASVLRPSAEEDDDEGPFFDLEFAVPDDDSDGEGEDGGEDEDDLSAAGLDEREFKFAVSPDGQRSDSSLSLSPSDDLFFKGRLVPLEPASLVVAAATEPDSKPQSAVSLLKSATKLSVLMLAFRKPKSSAAEAAAPPKQQQQSKLIKFKVEEVPIVSLFARDNSARSSGRAAKPHTEGQAAAAAAAAAAEDRKFSKEVVQKYINKIKPLYLRVSKRYGEKLRFSGLLSSEGPNKEEAKEGEAEPAGGCVRTERPIVPAGLRVVRKRLGKSRSSSSAVAAVPSPPPPPPPPRRRDDSLLQQQDGIQSAIAHCKRSFHADRGSESPLVRSKSDPGDERAEEDDTGEACV